MVASTLVSLSQAVSRMPLGTAWAVLAQTAEPGIRKLDPPTRAKVLAALAGLIILGLSLMLLTWLWGRATRRYMGLGAKKRATVDPDDWSQKPMHED